MKKAKKNVLPTERQLEIINDHLQVPGAENFNFFPKFDGKSVYMVDKNTGQTTLITQH